MIRSSFALKVVNGQLEMHRDIDVKDLTSAVELQRLIKSVLKTKLSNKMSWKQRFSKVNSMLSKHSGSNTMKVLCNAFAKDVDALSLNKAGLQVEEVFA